MWAVGKRVNRSQLLCLLVSSCSKDRESCIANSPVGINQLQPLLSTIVCDAVLDEDVEAGCVYCVWSAEEQSCRKAAAKKGNDVWSEM